MWQRNAHVKRKFARLCKVNGKKAVDEMEGLHLYVFTGLREWGKLRIKEDGNVINLIDEEKIQIKDNSAHKNEN